jgi:SAM-dependent methyltransferase
MGGFAPDSIGRRLRTVSMTLFSRLYGEELWQYDQSRFRPIVCEALDPIEGIIVDAACGSWNAYLYGRTSAETVGIDVDPAVRDRNRIHRRFLIQDLHDEIGLQEVGAIVSVNTWEHLRCPETVLRNFHKILKRGSPLIIIAPQRHHYISLLNLILPKPFQDFAWRVNTAHKEMPFPAFYRLCNRNSLARAAAANGFDLVEYRSSAVATPWLLAVPPAFLLACGWMSLTNRFEALAPLRSSFVAVLRKK